MNLPFAIAITSVTFASTDVEVNVTIIPLACLVFFCCALKCFSVVRLSAQPYETLANVNIRQQAILEVNKE
jgi:hypothetical protein